MNRDDLVFRQGTCTPAPLPKPCHPHRAAPGRTLFRSNSRIRSGEANRSKFARWASPHSCTSSPATGVSFSSAAMILAAPRPAAFRCCACHCSGQRAGGRPYSVSRSPAARSWTGTDCLRPIGPPERVLDRLRCYYAKADSGDLLMALMSPFGAFTAGTREMAQRGPVHRRLRRGDARTVPWHPDAQCAGGDRADHRR